MALWGGALLHVPILLPPRAPVRGSGPRRGGAPARVGVSVPVVRRAARARGGRVACPGGGGHLSLGRWPDEVLRGEAGLAGPGGHLLPAVCLWPRAPGDPGERGPWPHPLRSALPRHLRGPPGPRGRGGDRLPGTALEGPPQGGPRLPARGGAVGAGPARHSLPASVPAFPGRHVLVAEDRPHATPERAFLWGVARPERGPLPLLGLGPPPRAGAVDEPDSPGHRGGLRGRGVHLGRALVPLRHDALRVPARTAGCRVPVGPSQGV